MVLYVSFDLVQQEMIVFQSEPAALMSILRMLHAVQAMELGTSFIISIKFFHLPNSVPLIE